MGACIDWCYVTTQDDMACDIFMHGGIRTQVVLYYAFLEMLQLWNSLHSTSQFRDHVVIVYPRYDAKSRL